MSTRITGTCAACGEHVAQGRAPFQSEALLYANRTNGAFCPSAEGLPHSLTPRITAAELRKGDVVGYRSDDTYTVERVTHRDARYHEVVWADTNDGQPYAYMGDESWPLISRAEASQPDSTLVAAIRQGIREGSTDETALDILVDALRDLAARWTETADAIRPDVDESFGYDSAQDERDDAIADTLDESVTGLLQIVGHADHPDLPLSLIQKLEA